MADKQEEKQGNTQEKHVNSSSGKSIVDTLVDCIESGRDVEPYLLQQLASLQALTQRIHEGFCLQPFLPGQLPTSPRNLRRVSKYFMMLRTVIDLRGQVVDQWMRSHGMSPKAVELSVKALLQPEKRKPAGSRGKQQRSQGENAAARERTISSADMFDPPETVYDMLKFNKEAREEEEKAKARRKPKEQDVGAITEK